MIAVLIQSVFCPCAINICLNMYIFNCGMGVDCKEMLDDSVWKLQHFRSFCFTLDVEEGARKQVYPCVKLLQLLKAQFSIY